MSQGNVVPLQQPKRKPGAQPGHKGSPNAGRPHRRTTIRSQQIAEEWVASGKPMPLNVMLENMLYYHVEADKLLQQVGLWAKPPKDDKERADRLNLLKVLSANRERAQSCAVDAAPFMHPSLKSVEFDSKNGAPFIIKISRGDENL